MELLNPCMSEYLLQGMILIHEDTPPAVDQEPDRNYFASRVVAPLWRPESPARLFWGLAGL